MTAIEEEYDELIPYKGRTLKGRPLHFALWIASSESNAIGLDGLEDVKVLLCLGCGKPCWRANISMPTTRPVWDRALSSYILVFDDDWTVRVPGSAGSESPLALIPAEYVGDEFMVRVVEFPGEGNSISVGGMYDATQEIPRQAGDLGFLLQSFGIRAQNSTTSSQVGTKGSRREAAALKPGDAVMVRWVAGTAEVLVNEVRIWHGSLLAPARARRFFGASVADNAVLRIEATQKHSRAAFCYTERLLQMSCFSDVTMICMCIQESLIQILMRLP
eukprot:symbB.v1.2.000444.t5/scaffold32.1/size405148/17